MKKIIAAFSVILAVAAMSMPSYAHAIGNKEKAAIAICKIVPFLCQKVSPKKPPFDKPGKGTPVVHEVPEINAASGGIALTLLAGIFAIGRERRRKRNS